MINKYNNIKLVHWPLMGGLLHLVQRGGDWAGPQPAQALLRCTKCNSHWALQFSNPRAHPSTASVPITILLYNGLLLRGFNVPIWCLILVFVITWHQCWSSCTGYLSNTESNTSCVQWCIKSTLDVHHSRPTWFTLCSQSLNPVVDPVWSPPTPLTTSNVALELHLVNVASVTLVQLPGIPYLTVLSLSLTPIDFKIF